MGAMASQITSLMIDYLPFIQPQTKENIKAPRPWPLFGEFIGDRWIPRTNGQLRRKCFHLMTSSCERGFWRVQCQISSSISKSIELRESTTPHWKVICGIHWCEFKLNWPVSLSCLYEPSQGGVSKLLRAGSETSRPVAQGWAEYCNPTKFCVWRAYGTCKMKI